MSMGRRATCMLLPAILALTSPRVTANAANALLRAGQIGATHWAGCYNRTTAPYLQVPLARRI